MNSALKTLIALTLVAMTVSACGGSKTTNNVQATTVGEELASLDAAYRQGLLTEKEYEQQRRKILKGS
ncbi:hypothetical protein BXY66_0576 [Shimia isoporae]|uniref:Oligomerization/nucleic acid binding protein n=1 Tax=Shimia isoporae TaxID=647720 RepID=A0A4R1NLG0_9RHOB|nr:SHOCT domain-containing protein [Shimia isoporae]TCL08539.1 hypothetical protein BXY66_0576 [Shimia isoporae]